MKYLMGIDVGTSSCKVGVFSEEGVAVALEIERYEVVYSTDGAIDLDAEEVWTAAVTAIRRANVSSGGVPVEAISISSQGEAVIPVDIDGNPLARCPVSADLRGAKYVLELAGTIGPEKLHTLTGQSVDPIHSIGNIRWWIDNSANVRESASSYLGFPEFFHLKMGLTPSVDYTLAARMMLFDINQFQWAEHLVDFAGILESQLPNISESGTVLGAIPEIHARALGFSNQPAVVLGGHDQVMAAIGAGITVSQPVYSIGTTECMVFKSDVQQKINSDLLPSYPLFSRGFFVTLNGSQSGGRILSWLVDFLAVEGERCESCNRELWSRIDRSGIDYRNSLLVSTKRMMRKWSDESSSLPAGLITGIDISTTKDDLIHGILESITYEQAIDFLSIEKHINEVELIRAVGGGSKSDLWLQIKADSLGYPIVRTRHIEAASAGAAMLAGVGTGIFSSIEVAQQDFSNIVYRISQNVEYSDYHINKIKQYKISFNA